MGRSALRGILGEERYDELVQIAEQGTEHGGISIFTPTLWRLLHKEQYRAERPQFVHRWLLKLLLSRGVTVVTGRRVCFVDDKQECGVDVIFEDGTMERVDLVIG